jgi:hypothetical protein
MEKNLQRDENFLELKIFFHPAEQFTRKTFLILGISVQAKLRCLHDYHQRLLHNALPLPSGVDIANTIKYFSQTLLSEYS